MSIRPLLADPKSAWDRPAITTYKAGNHSVRSERWRYIRYAEGAEELYDRDPHEWTNLAKAEGNTREKAELAKWLPKENNVTPRNSRKAGKKAEKKKAKAEKPASPGTPQL